MSENKFYCARFYVTYRCNSRCSYCNVWREKKFRNVEELSAEKAKKLLRQCYEQGVRYVDFTGGEPTLYPHLAEIIKYAKELGIKTEVTSNCIAASSKQKMFEIAKVADKFNTSLDTLNEAAYYRIRGVDKCQAVKAAVGEIAKMRSPKIMTVVTKDNINELDNMLAYAAEHKAMIYLSPMFPYMDKDGNYQISEYMPNIINCIFKPYTVVLLHFMEFFKTSSPQKLPPCSANRHTLTLAPNGDIVLPCYHALIEQIPWNEDLASALQTETFKAYMQKSGSLDVCRGCCVIPYFGISFNYQLNKYFLLQSFSEKLYHLKRDGLNALLSVWHLDVNYLNALLQEMIAMAEHLAYEPSLSVLQGKQVSLYPAEKKGDEVLTPVYKNSLTNDEFLQEEKAQDCWQLTKVPHYYFDKFCHEIIYPLLQKQDLSAAEEEILKKVMEFQIHWWKIYINKYFKLTQAYDTSTDEKWVREYLVQANNYMEQGSLTLKKMLNIL